MLLEMIKIIVLSLFLSGCAIKPIVRKQVLFVGNSYTAISMPKKGVEHELNNTPKILQSLLGPKYLVQSCTHGGYSLSDHFKTKKCLDHFKERKWDVIIFQEKVPTLLANLQSSKSAIQGMMKWSPSSHFILFEAWARKGSSSDSSKLEKLYSQLRTDLKLTSMPVKYIWSHFKELPLYSKDGSHPSPLGIYLSALTASRLFRTKAPTPTKETLELLNSLEKNQATFGDSYPANIGDDLLHSIHRKFNYTFEKRVTP